MRTRYANREKVNTRIKTVLNLIANSRGKWKYVRKYEKYYLLRTLKLIPYVNLF